MHVQMRADVSRVGPLADISRSERHLRFSNRQVWLKRYSDCPRISLAGPVLLFGIGTKAFPAWDSRIRRLAPASKAVRHVRIGSLASIPRCPPHVRLAGNFGHAGWLLIALDRQWYIAYRSSDEALLAAMLRPAPFARGRLAGETGGLVRVTRKPQ